MIHHEFPWSLEDVRRMIAYDPETGECFWNECGMSRAVREIAVGSFRHRDNKVVVTLRRKKYSLPRVLYFHMTGVWVRGWVRQKDGDPWNFKFENLVPVEKN